MALDQYTSAVHNHKIFFTEPVARVVNQAYHLTTSLADALVPELSVRLGLIL